MVEDVAKLLTLGDFGTYSDATDGAAATPLAAVKITTLEADGSLEYDSTGAGAWGAVTLNQVITAADINAGRLRFVPDANENGSPYTTIGFQVSDGTAFSAASYTLTVNVAAANDAPVNTVPGAQTAVRGTPLAFVGPLPLALPTLSVSDDSANVTVTLSAPVGTFAAVGFAGTSSLTISGTLELVNAALATVTYLAPLNQRSQNPIILTMTTLDGVTSDVDTVSITVPGIVVDPGASGVLLGSNSGDFINLISTSANSAENQIRGFDGNDFLNGGNGWDRIFGEGGIDTLNGGLGNDQVLGGLGNDILSLGGGDDQGWGGIGSGTGDGNDQIDGGAGNDRIFGEDGDDTLLGGADNDHILGGAGADRIEGGGGNDGSVVGTVSTGLAGGAGDDDILGGEGNDFLWGDADSDTLEDGSGDDQMIGGPAMTQSSSARREGTIGLGATAKTPTTMA